MRFLDHYHTMGGTQCNANDISRRRRTFPVEGALPTECTSNALACIELYVPFNDVVATNIQ